jgi:DNA-binding CsgD family transcriptional regulator
VVVGRASERAVLAAFLDDIRSGPCALVFEGEQGIGKSVLWTEGVEEARARGYRVLSCRPTGSDSELSFVALGDLFDFDEASFLDALPEPQRDALATALLHRRWAGRPPDPRAAAVGTLGILGALAEQGEAVVAIDDVQWIDPATTRVLTFAARRISGTRLGFLLARPTTEESPPLGLVDALPADRLHIAHVGPLDPHEIAVIVRERSGLSLSRPEAGRLAELAGGNPFYAVEIARAQARGDEGVTGQRLPIPKSLREDLVRTRVGSVSSKTADMLLLAASMPRPTVDALQKVMPTESLDASLQQAIDAELVEILGLDFRFAHPLYRSAIYADASRRRRHQTHRRLAEVAADPEERGRHLALATDAPDPAVVEEVERAATLARGRGAPDVAAELLEHAVRLTPREDLHSLRRRLLQVAGDRLSAGDADGAQARAREALRVSSPGAEQAEPLRRIGGIEFARGALVEARASLDEALAQVHGDVYLAAEIHRELARVAIRAGEIGAAERNTEAALRLSEEAGDPSLARAAATTAAEVDLLLARSTPSLEATLDVREPSGPPVSDSPEFIGAQADVFADRLERAERRLQRLLAVARDHGDEPGRLLATTRLAELKIRSGSWELAEQLSGEARDLAVDLMVSDRLQLALMAYAAAGRGHTDDARALAGESLRAAETDRPTQLWCLSALGFLELSLARFPDALHHLGRAGGLLAETGIVDPAAFPFLSDEAEALIAAGEIDTASRRIIALEEMGERLDRDLVRGQAARCHGLALAAVGDVEGSLAALERASALHERVGIGMELGRSLLALGATRRRRREKRPAREVLDRALALFSVAGAAIWAERAREELARIGGRRASIGELTDSETRVARLAASGLSNREIARTLSMSVRTVEGHLSHVYAKLELRSRTELALFFQPPD